MGQVVGLDRTAVVAHLDAPLGVDHEASFEALVVRREAGEPVAYIREVKEFYGFALSVDTRALIPRPETELLVELAISRTRAAIAARPRRSGCAPLPGARRGHRQRRHRDRHGAHAAARRLRRGRSLHRQRHLRGRARAGPRERRLPGGRRPHRPARRRPALDARSRSTSRRASSWPTCPTSPAPRSMPSVPPSPSNHDWRSMVARMAWTSSGGCSPSCRACWRVTASRCSRSARTRRPRRRPPLPMRCRAGRRPSIRTWPACPVSWSWNEPLA